MASPIGPQDPAPYVVWKIEPRVSGLWSVYVQLPDGTSAVVVVPGVGVSLSRVRIAADVVAQLWEQKRGATPLAEG